MAGERSGGLVGLTREGPHIEEDSQANVLLSGREDPPRPRLISS